LGIVADIIRVHTATRSRRAALLVIAANFAFFAALLAVMFYLRATAVNWPAPFHFASLLMVGAMTMFSLCGSVTIAIGARALHLDEVEPAVRWVAIAVACWITFLFLEIVEWVRLVYLVGLGPRTTFGGSYLALTGTHWLAASACVCWMTYVAVDVRRRDVLAVALYSHFLNLWWIVLLFCLYFSNANLQGI
jgi:heme/copper-type cytochrome/quinol oxidase subunit 3